MFAVAADSAENVKKLIEYGANKNHRNKNGVTALILAVDKYDSTVLEHLLSTEIDLEIRNSWGGTALIYGLSRGHFGNMKKLVDSGADINARTDKGQTVLELYLSEDDFDMAGVDFFIKNGAVLPDNLTYEKIEEKYKKYQKRKKEEEQEESDRRRRKRKEEDEAHVRNMKALNDLIQDNSSYW
jgi:ankyrin repeat protein